MQNSYYCIFAGGGVRGTAYLGAIQALKEARINVSGLAGSSVGAIFAALYAIGYTCEEMREFIFSLNYEAFRDLDFSFGKDFGICRGDSLYNWFKKAIEKKFYGENFENINKPVTFKDINKDLTIITTDISHTTFKEYNKIKTPDVEIARAVRASISIPGFFKPVWDEECCLVDGDVINNFPIWTFSENMKSHGRILEFRLESTERARDIRNPLDYFSAILDTSYSVSTDFLINGFGQNDQFDIVRINTGKIQVIDFAISNKEKEKLINNGYTSTLGYLKQDLSLKKKQLIVVYRKISEDLKKFRSDIKYNKIKDAQIILGNISIYLAENHSLIHPNLYEQIINFKKLYFENIYKTNFLGFDGLKDRKNVIHNLNNLQIDIDFQIKEIQNYLSTINEVINSSNTDKTESTFSGF